MNSLSTHTIFKQFHDAPHSLPTNPHTVVCRNNNEIYFAYKTWIRCCSLGIEQGFKLIDMDNDDVHALVLNSSNSLLAAVKERSVSIIQLPDNLLKEPTLLKPKIQHVTMKDRIVSAVWHEGLKNDSTLVILTEKHILCYDTLLSVHFPTLSEDLSKMPIFEKSPPRGLCFGGKDLMGSLTLHIATANEVYSWYPFLPQCAQIVTTREAVEEAFQKSLSVVQALDKKFPYSSVFAPSALKTRAMHQHRFYEHLREQSMKKVSLTEVRNVSSTTPRELLVLSPIIRVEGVAIQGPVIKENGIVDVNIVGQTISVLSHQNNATLAFYAQLNPPLMEWTDTAEISRARIPVPSPPKKAHGYKKIAKGFGYVSLSDDEDDGEKARYSEAMADHKLIVSRVKAENDYKNTHLSLLTKLQEDVFETSTAPSQLVVYEDKFVFSVDSVIYGHADWTSKLNHILLKNAKQGEIHLDLQTSYKKIAQDPKTTYAALVVSDVDSGTGDYAVVCSTKSQTDAVLIPLGEQKEKVKITNSPRNHPTYLGSPKEPLLELERSIPNVNHHLHANPTPLYNTTILEKSEYLVDLNQYSNRVGKLVTALTSVCLRMYSRMGSQEADLHDLIDKLAYALEKVPSEDTRGAVERAQARQKAIKERLGAVEDKLRRAIYKTKQAKSLPLSKAEEEWFKEIERISKRDDEALMKGVRELVDELRSEEFDRNSRVLEVYENNGRLQELVGILEREGKGMESIRERLQRT